MQGHCSSWGWVTDGRHRASHACGQKFLDRFASSSAENETLSSKYKAGSKQLISF